MTFSYLGDLIKAELSYDDALTNHCSCLIDQNACKFMNYFGEYSIIITNYKIIINSTQIAINWKFPSNRFLF